MNKEALYGIIAYAASDGYSLDSIEEVESLVEYLLTKGVTVITNDAIILTREELNALNEYAKRTQKKGIKSFLKSLWKCKCNEKK